MIKYGAIFLSAWIGITNGQYALQTVTNPGLCYGGQICGIQPSVSVVNSATQQIDYSFQGSAYVQLSSSPTGYESLYFGQNCDHLSCGQKVVGSLVSVPFVNGLATFSELMLKTAGTGYTLKFIGKMSAANNEKLFAFSYSSTFTVFVGPPFQLIFLNFSFAGNSFGGSVFAPNPSVAVADRGGNVVPIPMLNYTGQYMVTAFLSTTPHSPSAPGEELLPVSSLTTSVVNGRALFQNLYINKAGYPYVISFSINKLAMPNLVSKPFTVAVGPSAQITYVSGELSASRKYAGEFFKIPPRVKLLDAGGNLVNDNQNGVQVSIYGNPTGASIGPNSSVFSVAKNGIVTFSALAINKAGVNYTLLFRLYKYSTVFSNFSASNVALLSEKFDVYGGVPRKLEIVTPASGAWAGNQAFSTQPVLQTVGYGNDYLLNDFSSVVKCSIVRSLSVGKSLVVYTANAPTTVISMVGISLNNGSYGTGQIVDFYVQFSADVWVRDLNPGQFNTSANSTTQSVYSTLAFLWLNGNSNSGENTIATLLAYNSSSVSATKSLTFRYVVTAGDSATDLDYLDRSSLILNNSLIVDGNDREVNLTLPYHGVSARRSVSIDTSSPRIQSVVFLTPDGEYGAGQEIVIEVTYDLPVQVRGVPFIRLSSHIERPTSHPTESPTHSPTRIPPTRPPNAVNPTLSPSVVPTDEPSLEPSAAPTTSQPTLSPGNTAVYNSTIDPTFLPTSLPSSRPSSRPTSHPSYGYHSDGVAFYNSTSDDKMSLIFIYKVGINDFTGPTQTLSIVSNILEFRDTRNDWIRRYANDPTTAADLTIQSAQSTNIIIDTTPPVLDSAYGVQTDHEDGTFYPGEVIRLSVQFDKPIVAKGDAIYLVLDCGPRFPGASYNGFAYIDNVLSDNKTIEFKYVVEANVNTTNKLGIKVLDIESGRSALVVVASEAAYIRRLSTSPLTDADLYTDSVFGSLSAAHSIELFGFPTVVQSVTIVSTDPSPASSLQPDDSAIIAVQFSGPVIANCSPVFVVAVGFYREAVYVGGNGTNVFQFRYTVQVGDFSNSTLQYRHTPYALCANSGCYYPTNCFLLSNSTNPVLPVNLKLPRLGTRPYWEYTPGVSIDTLSIERTRNGVNTTITNIQCVNPPGEYGAGSVLRFEVTFKDVVDLRTSPGSSKVYPLLFLNIVGSENNTMRYAEYSGGSPGRVIRFIYITKPDDSIVSDSGTYVGAAFITGDSSLIISTAILCLRNQTCFFQNEAGQVVDLDLSSTRSIVQDSTNSGVYLNASAPFVTEIWSDKGISLYDEEEYTVGEQINVYVNVSKPVLVAGFSPRILLDVNISERYAIYNSKLSTDSTLVFVYTVSQGDYSSNLAFKGNSIDLYGGHCQIFRKSDLPETLMDVSLRQFSSRVLSKSAPIRINTDTIPRVLNVTFDGIGNGSYNATFASSSPSPTALRFAAGDIISISVEMSMFVTAIGRSYLLLNAGDHTVKAKLYGYYSPFAGGQEFIFNSSTNQSQVILEPSGRKSFGQFTHNFQLATGNYPSLPTKKLIYRYEVGFNDLNSRLDYVDCFSLFPGRKDSTDPGYIRRSSAAPAIDADLTLPIPGLPGSLSVQNIFVDGRAPYLTSIEFLTPVGIYGTEDKIIIAMNFSSSVFVKLGDKNGPYLILDAGSFNGSAFYSSGSGTRSLLFEYAPQPGHYSSNLDYRCDSIFCSANASFVYNGAQILSNSANPTVPAEIWLNPPQGTLIGSSTASAFEGQSPFSDVGISQRGPDYLLRYTRVATFGSNVTSEEDLVEITTTQTISNSFSSEFEIRPKEALKNELIGFAVDIEGDIAILGSPNSNRSVTTIQAVTSSALQHSPQQEVQLISTSATPQPGIISFHSTANVEETVGGTYTLSYGIYGPTAPIPANAEGEMLHAILSYSLPELGNVTISRVPYIYCACSNAFTWTFTFNDINQGIFHTFVVDDSKLTGSGAAIAGVTILQSPSLLSGTFSLSLSHPLKSVVSVTVPFDATYTQMAAAITSLGLPVYEVETTPTQPTLGRSWLVTFNAYHDSYEIPLLSANNSGLGGARTTEVYTKVIQPGIHGPNGIAGYFQLQWRGNTTVALPATASAAVVKSALEELPVINFVNVNRSEPSAINGYTWTIEFVSVNIYTPRGYQLQDTENLEPIVPINNLIATNATLTVQAHWLGIGQPIHLYDIAREGTYGSGAGAVYIFQRRKELWNQVATIMANDTAENSQFGYSVSLTNDLFIVGSIGANLDGVPEKQAITCSAQEGFFEIKFRGWSTNPISYNVTRTQLIDAIVNVPGTFDNLYPIFSISIDDWGVGGLCENNETAVITFYSPVEGTILYPKDTGPHLELLTVVNLNLTLTVNGTKVPGDLSVREVQAGTWLVEGNPADLQQTGAAYIFRAQYSCSEVILNSSDCVKSEWIQEAKIFPSTLPINSRFGYSVAITDSLAVVGAPGTSLEKGYVYVFQFSAAAQGVGGQWSLLQLFIDPTLSTNDHFGTVVAASGNTIIIGSPGYADGTGAVYVYKRTVAGGTFIATQSLIPSILLYPLLPGCLFGSSVAIDSNTVVVGSIGFNDSNAVYLGNSPSGISQLSSGAAFVFQRSNSLLDFSYYQHLTPSNVRSFDRFGYGVDIDGNNIIVSSLEAATNLSQPAKAVIEIRTEAVYNAVPLSGYFKIKWLFTNSSSDGFTLTTRAIPYNAAAQTMKAILQTDLPPIGNILVSRSNMDVFNGGYSWLVTFLSSDSDNVATLFQSDTTALKGTNASVVVNLINPTPKNLRGKAHLFQRSSFASQFVEEMFLTPYAQQVVDRCGSSVSINGKFALVGCPNRDQSVPGQNSGAGFIFNLAPLALTFSNSKYTISEGDILNVQISHDAVNNAIFDETTYFYVRTIDRNAPASMQKFLENLYGIIPSALVYPTTVIDGTRVTGKAIARSQYYGSTHNESRWVDGMYDYRAISDYVPIDNAHSFPAAASVAIDSVVTTKDTIFENPDELFALAIVTPGIWPGVFSRLYATVTILDGGNGYSNVSGTLEFDYHKAYDSGSVENDRLGEAVAVNDDLGVMFAGSPFAQIGARTNGGKVVHFAKSPVTGKWVEVATLTSPLTGLTGRYFGQSIAVTYISGIDLSILVIGEPGINRAHVYLSQGSEIITSGQAYSYDISFSVPDAVEPQDRFGESVSAYGYLVAIGAPGLDAVYLYNRLFDASSGLWYWSKASKLVSSDYDYNVIYGQFKLHRQEFGKSISISERTIIVGAPYADYDKLGYDKPGYNLIYQDWDSEGTSILSYGRGKAYVFYSAPSSQKLSLFSSQPLSSGDFQLMYSHRHEVRTTRILPFDVSAEDLKAALTALSNIDEVLVTATFAEVVSDGYLTTWMITFLSDWQTPALLEPQWNGFGCENCTAFSSNPTGWVFNTTLNRTVMGIPANNSLSNNTLTDSLQMQVEWVQHYVGPVVEWQNLTASDKQSGNRFGWAVSVDGEQLAVGAPFSASLSGTTWDFEAGSLQGWSKTGTAFDYQPTFGDNSYYRASEDRVTSTASFSATASVTGVFFLGELRGKGVSSRLKGLYYIGTYEMRPGDPTDLNLPDPSYPEGNAQGDAPTGTLSSDVFIIYGSVIQFLIGGGCDIYKVYVELLVDGLSVAKQTGQCSESMYPAQFKVAEYINRAAQIRIVDNGTSLWGHISVDQFKFDWPIDGGATVSNGLKSYSGGLVGTPQSGEVYVFRRVVPQQESVVCSDTMMQLQCQWQQEVKFAALDKRSSAWFGYSVAINDSSGVLAVGAPGAPLTGFYKETPTAYPYMNSTTGSSDASGLKFPLSAKLQTLFESQPLYVPERSGGSGVWITQQADGISSDSIAAHQTGAVYIYKKKQRTISNTGQILQQQYWNPGEQAKLQPPDGFADDNFGTSISLDDTLLAVGAPGQDGLLPDAGASYAYAIKFVSVSFSSDNYVILEGSKSFITLTIYRDTTIYDGLLVLEYATSDLTATGIDAEKYLACSKLATADRGPAGCGDYMQTAGFVTILPGERSGGFNVNIVDDTCNESNMKYIQVTLSVPGSAALQGETLSAMIRIDDNDFASTQYC